MAGAPAIETCGLVKCFGDHRAVDGVDLTVATGTVYAVLGPNGAGKTTTVRMLATLTRPTEGSARVFGVDVSDDPRRVRRMIGLTGQYATVDEGMTATENLVVFGRLHGRSRRAARSDAADLLDRFGLTAAAGRRVATFSGGMRRRLDLAASLVARPPLLFLDEPTTGLDPRTRQGMWETVRGLVADGTTVLLTTQYLEEADQLADRIAVIDHGRVVAEGTADDLKAAVGTERLELTPADPGDITRAIAVVGRHAAGAVPTADGRAIAVRPPSTAVLGAMLTAVAQAGIEVAAVSVVRPSLDDVFFAITDTDSRPDRGEDAA
ncbi:ATP-binding cassette domain-containing protein [uncultured Williamsia sp.]|uniref:ATP-binding cassette domain-containing protein n=1 Tax=uncultured Williamsia sp. TaxID=259311 RepID=UPI002613336C|nr:ATP-binding cassette domain-containing protein [uncultured Williamsia sp.]